MSELCPRLMRATSAFPFSCIPERIPCAALVRAVFPSQPSPAMTILCPLSHRRLASFRFPSTHSLNSRYSNGGCLDLARSQPFPTTPLLHLQVRSYSRDDGDASSPPPSSVTQKGKYSRGLGVRGVQERRRDIVEPKPGSGSGLARSRGTLTKYYATCSPGLEEVLAAELASPLVGAQEVEVGSAGVSFVGSQATGYQASLWLRTAVRVLVQLAAGPLPAGRGQYDPVYTFIRDAVDWPSILVDDSLPPTQQQQRRQQVSSNLQSYRHVRDFERKDGDELHKARFARITNRGYRFRNFAVQSRVWNCTDISNSNFASVRAKDAICDSVRDACGGHRPDPPAPELMVDVPLFLSLYRDTAVLYRDLSGVSLHKRGYRDVMHKASLNEGIAAAVLTLAGWNPAISGFGDANKNALGPERVLLDPMCGSGTFLIEAALMMTNTAPGLFRRQWPFQTWHDFDQRSWKQCKDAAVSAQLSSIPGVRLLGNDIHEGALSLCKKDAKSAGVLHLLDLSCEDCQDYHPPVIPSLVVTNPPWGERLADSSSNEEKEWLYATWQGLGRFVKAQCSCADVYVLSGNADVTRAMHMRADKKWPLTIGGQERKLLHYHVLPRKLS